VSRRAEGKALLFKKNVKNRMKCFRIDQQKTGAKLFCLMKPPSDCLGHLENLLFGDENKCLELVLCLANSEGS